MTKQFTQITPLKTEVVQGSTNNLLLEINFILIYINLCLLIYVY